MRRLNVAVVGAGIAGLSASRNLAERGHHVTLFEQFPFGHEKGSSHGRSRIIRRAYSDPFYTECMRDAYPLWKELERTGKETLIHEVGLLYFGDPQAENLLSTERGLKELHVPYRKFEGESVHKVFPDLQMQAHEIGLFTPEAGWIDATKALSVTYDLAVKGGVSIVIKYVSSADLHCFDKVIVTAGAWIKDWWPQAPVTVSLQTFGYVKAEISGPVWIEESDSLLYGFPSENAGVKVGVHRPGREVDPHQGDRTPDSNDLGEIANFCKHRFGIVEPTILDPKGCLYTNTASEDFFLSQIDAKTILASACSGHGFKFGPWFGRLLADIVEERQDVAAYGRFLA